MESNKNKQQTYSKLIEKDIRFMVTEGRGRKNWSGQKAQNSSYKINKYQGCNVQHKDHS